MGHHLLATAADKTLAQRDAMIVPCMSRNKSLLFSLAQFPQCVRAAHALFEPGSTPAVCVLLGPDRACSYNVICKVGAGCIKDLMFSIGGAVLALAVLALLLKYPVVRAGAGCDPLHGSTMKLDIAVNDVTEILVSLLHTAIEFQLTAPFTSSPFLSL